MVPHETVNFANFGFSQVAFPGFPHHFCGIQFYSTIIVKSVGQVAFFTSSFPSSPCPWPNVDQNVNVCACNCSVISQH